MDIKAYGLLRKSIKGLAVKHLQNKADAFTAFKLGLLLNEIFTQDDPKQLVKKIAIVLL